MPSDTFEPSHLPSGSYTLHVTIPGLTRHIGFVDTAHAVVITLPRFTHIQILRPSTQLPSYRDSRPRPGHTPVTSPGTTASQPRSRRQTPAAGPRSYTRHSSRHAAQINDNRARCNQYVVPASYHAQTNKPLEKRE